MNLENNTWFPVEAVADGSTPEARTGHTAVYDPESCRIYVFGGSKNKKWFNDVHILDTEAWRWRSVEVREYMCFLLILLLSPLPVFGSFKLK